MEITKCCTNCNIVFTIDVIDRLYPGKPSIKYHEMTDMFCPFCGEEVWDESDVVDAEDDLDDELDY